MGAFLRGIITADRPPLIDDFYVVGVEQDAPVQMILFQSQDTPVCRLRLSLIKLRGSMSCTTPLCA